MCHNSLPVDSFEQFTGGDDTEPMIGGDEHEEFIEAPEPFNGGDDGLEGMYGQDPEEDDGDLNKQIKFKQTSI